MKNHKADEIIQSMTTSQGFGDPPNRVRKTNNGFCLVEGATVPQHEQTAVAWVFLLLFLPLILFFIPIAVALVVIGFLVQPRYRRDMLMRLSLLPAEIQVPSHPFRLGESITLQFHRHLRFGSTTRRPARLILNIACVERVQYTKGSDTETTLRVVWVSHDVVQEIPAGANTLSMTALVAIPRSLSPSFEGTHNQIRWVASISQSFPGTKRHTRSNFTVFVSPELVDSDASNARRF